MANGKNNKVPKAEQKPGWAYTTGVRSKEKEKAAEKPIKKK